MRKEELFQRIDEEREELWSMADQIFDNPESVSYTHLDVYKRQTLLL